MTQPFLKAPKMKRKSFYCILISALCILLASLDGASSNAMSYTSTSESSLRSSGLSPLWVAESQPIAWTLVIEVTQLVRNVTYIDANTENFMSALTSAVAETLRVPASKISIDQISANTTVKALEVSAVYTVTTMNSDPTILIDLLSTSLITGAFSNSLTTYGYLYAVAYDLPDITMYSRAATPSSSSTSTAMDGGVFGVSLPSAAGAITAIVLLVFLVTYCCTSASWHSCCFRPIKITPADIRQIQGEDFLELGSVRTIMTSNSLQFDTSVKTVRLNLHPVAL